MGPDRGASERGERRLHPLKSHSRILDEELALADEEMERPAAAIAASALLAGLTVGISVLLIAMIASLPGVEPDTLLHRFLVGNAYAAGFIVVIFARADLFTEYTTIALVPVMLGRSSIGALARLWGIVYAANLVGAFAVAAFLVWVGQGHGFVAPGAFGEAAHGLVGHSVTGMVLSAVLAGWLMGLMSWLIVAGRETISQVIFVWVIGTTIGTAALHHSITGSAEVAAALFAGELEATLDLVRFVAASTAGNALGAVAFASLARYSVVMEER